MRNVSLAIGILAAALTNGVSAQVGGSGSCDRACLQGFVDQYLTALVAR